MIDIIIGSRLAARGSRLAADRRVFARAAFAAIAAIFGVFCALAFSFALADKAAAQQLPQTSISYSAEPDDLVSVNANGQLIVLSQPSAGLMTATIHGTEFSLVGGDYVRTGYSGMQVLTLRFLTSCSVTDGCDVFGLDSGDTVANRAFAFRRMSLATLSMFVAAGADVNEIIGAGGSGQQADNHLLFQMALVGNGAAVSLLVTAGANINATGRAGSTMLHYAAARINTNNGGRLLTILLEVEGISVNATNNGATPLDLMAQIHGLFPSADRLPLARILRDAGGRCETQANNNPPSVICTGE